MDQTQKEIIVERLVGFKLNQNKNKYNLGMCMNLMYYPHRWIKISMCRYTLLLEIIFFSTCLYSTFHGIKVMNSNCEFLTNSLVKPRSTHRLFKNLVR